MDSAEKDWLRAEFANIKETVKAEVSHVVEKVETVDERVSGIEVKVDDHAEEIVRLSEFKEGHQTHHLQARTARRWNWEMIALILLWLGDTIISRLGI